MSYKERVDEIVAKHNAKRGTKKRSNEKVSRTMAKLMIKHGCSTPAEYRELRRKKRSS